MRGLSHSTRLVPMMHSLNPVEPLRVARSTSMVIARFKANNRDVNRKDSTIYLRSAREASHFIFIQLDPDLVAGAVFFRMRNQQREITTNRQPAGEQRCGDSACERSACARNRNGNACRGHGSASNRDVDTTAGAAESAACSA